MPHTHFLTRTPSPKVIMEAFARVRPKLIVAVPLIIEKNHQDTRIPDSRTPADEIAYARVPVLDDHLLAKIKQKIIDSVRRPSCANLS